MHASRQNIKVQQLVTCVAVILFIIKLWAWYITNSVSILTDALESTINVITGFIGLYSLYLSAQPKDSNHPYGHGKVEFVSAAIEGTLIFVAGLILIYKSILNISSPHELQKLNSGIVLIFISAILNLIVGLYASKTGKRNNSLALMASGKHLLSDMYSTLAIIIGLIIVSITGFMWIDSAVALVFALIIIRAAFKILRQSIAGIMDEADLKLLGKAVTLLNTHRKADWIDLHNLRIIKYGSVLHLDSHLTVPWYYNIHEAHKAIDELETTIKSHFGESVELFVHTDACFEFSCKLCQLESCTFRKHDFIHKIDWTIENISANSRHQLP